MRFDRLLIVSCALAALFGCGGGGGGGNGGPRIFAVTEANRLISFDPDSPGTIESDDALTGLAVGETVLGIDFRPANGFLYALGSTGQLYTIDLDLAAAVPVGSGVGISLTGASGVGFDFQPVADRIRIVTDNDLNFRVNPDTGLAVDTDLGTGGIQGDTDINPNTSWITAIAHKTETGGSTTLYGIDVDDGELVLIGGINGTPSPNGGVRTDVGSLAVPTAGTCSLDITASGTAFLAADDGSNTIFYTVNLTTGAATTVGTLGGSHDLLAISFRP